MLCRKFYRLAFSDFFLQTNFLIVSKGKLKCPLASIEKKLQMLANIIKRFPFKFDGKVFVFFIEYYMYSNCVCVNVSDPIRFHQNYCADYFPTLTSNQSWFIDCLNQCFKAKRNWADTKLALWVVANKWTLNLNSANIQFKANKKKSKRKKNRPNLHLGLCW